MNILIFWSAIVGAVTFIFSLLTMGSLYLIFRRNRLRLPPRTWDQATALISRTCTVNGDTIQYWELIPPPAIALSKDAKPLQVVEPTTFVLLHGIGAWSYTWRELVPHLGRHSRLIIVDLPGFGMSAKNPTRAYDLDEQTSTMLAFLDTTHISNPVLVGSSMGGAIALWMAKIKPPAVRAVVAISPAVNGLRYWMPLYVPYPVLRIFSFLTGKLMFRLIIRNVVSGRDKVNDELITEYWRPFAENPESVVTFVKALKIVFDPRLPAALAGLSEQLPICILWGSEDKMTPIRDYKLLSLYLPRANFHSHPTAGHHLMEDEPAWCAEKIVKFLDESRDLGQNSRRD